MAQFYSKTRTRAELLKRVGKMDQVAGVRLAELTDGTARGVRVADVRAGLVNPQGFGFYVRYRQRELPCFNEWKMMGEGVYAVGMEPATNWVTGRASERERGALQLLQPCEQRHYHLEFGLLTGLDEAAELEQQIGSLAKG